MTLEPIEPQSMTDKDLEWLVKFVASCYDDTTTKGLLEGLVHGIVVIWRAPDGLVICTKTLRKGEKELYLNGYAGNGLLQHAKEIMEFLREYARLHGAKRVVGIPHDPRLWKFYERIGAKCVRREYAVEA